MKLFREPLVVSNKAIIYYNYNYYYFKNFVLKA